MSVPQVDPIRWQQIVNDLSAALTYYVLKLKFEKQLIGLQQAAKDHIVHHVKQFMAQNPNTNIVVEQQRTTLELQELAIEE